MAKVFTGGITIPGDKIEDFFRLLAEGEKAKEPFRNQLNALNVEFECYLLSRLSDRTARKHVGVIELFIDFLCRNTDIFKIEDITKGVVNTHFCQWYKRKVISSSTPNDLKVALCKFFQFLADEKGIINAKVLAGLQK